MNSFEFFEPTTLAEASRLFAQEHAQLLAGGTDLVIGMKALTETPQSVISLQKIPGLAGVTTEADGSISIGAMTKAREVELSADIQKHHTALAEGAAEIGSIQIRNLATMSVETLRTLLLLRIQLPVCLSLTHRLTSQVLMANGPCQSTNFSQDRGRPS